MNNWSLTKAITTTNEEPKKSNVKSEQRFSFNKMLTSMSV